MRLRWKSATSEPMWRAETWRVSSVFRPFTSSRYGFTHAGQYGSLHSLIDRTLVLSGMRMFSRVRKYSPEAGSSVNASTVWPSVSTNTVEEPYST